jgi:ribosomal protein S18 acetylase RimI-like enzyme
MNDNLGLIAYITTILVHENAQNRGIGRMLLEKTESYCVTNGFKSIRLEVNKKNDKAIRFYLSNGFVLLTENKESSYYMQKDLTTRFIKS